MDQPVLQLPAASRTFRAGFSDAQCGFKAMRTDVARQILPLVDDDGWFFDTELLVLAEHNGFRVHEVPVDWVDDPDSRVDLIPTVVADLRGMARLSKRLVEQHRSEVVDRPNPGPADDALASQLVRFGSIGLVSTVVFAGLFALLRPQLGTVGADVVALAICAAANTEANRRLTFTLRGQRRRANRHVAAIAVSMAPLALNLATLGVLAAFDVTSTTEILVALTAVNGIAALARFLLLRRWVFPARSDSSGDR